MTTLLRRFALLPLVTAPLAAQGVDSIEVTPPNVIRPVTQNTGTGVGACQQFLPWAYDASGIRVRQQQTYAWTVSNSADFQVDTAGGNVCARQTQLSDTVTTTVTATIEGTQVSGTANFTVTPDPAAPPPPTTPTTAMGAPTAAQPTAGGEAVMDTALLPPAPAPTNVTVTPISPTTLQIAWGGVAGASGYYLYRSTSAEGQFTPQNTALLQGNLTTDPTLMPNTLAYYKVAAVVPNKSLGLSAAASNVTPPAPNPASLTATLTPDQKSVTLTWPAPAGASGYQLYKGGGLVSTTPLRTTSYTDTALVPGTTYKYQVAALYTSTKHGEFEGDLLNMPSATVTRSEAMYRVLFTGFKVSRQTDDDPLQLDGKGDEVYISAPIVNVELKADTTANLDIKLYESITMGDDNGFPARGRYGSASASGGLRTGDEIRFHVPWQVWSGKLWDRTPPAHARYTGNVVLIGPTVWEFDGSGPVQKSIYNAWKITYAPAPNQRAGCQDPLASGLASNPGVRNGFVSYVCVAYLPGFVNGGLSGQDKQIGYFAGQLMSVKLTLRGAEQLLNGKTNVELLFPYADGRMTNGQSEGVGQYVIFLRLERL